MDRGVVHFAKATTMSAEHEDTGAEKKDGESWLAKILSKSKDPTTFFAIIAVPMALEVGTVMKLTDDVCFDLVRLLIWFFGSVAIKGACWAMGLKEHMSYRYKIGRFLIASQLLLEIATQVYLFFFLGNFMIFVTVVVLIGLAIDYTILESAYDYFDKMIKKEEGLLKDGYTIAELYHRPWDQEAQVNYILFEKMQEEIDQLKERNMRQKTKIDQLMKRRPFSSITDVD